MAVTLTTAELAAALRITAPDAETTAVLDRLLETATAIAEAYAPAAPEAVQNEAAIRLSSYLFDAPDSPGSDRWAYAWRNSGAAGLAAPFVEHRALPLEGDAAATPETPDTPSDTGGAGVDQAARDAAAAAQRTADSASAAATANASFLSTFTGRVRAIVESIVPAWARAASPPDPVDQTARDGVATNTREAARQQQEIEANRASAADARRIAVANQGSFDSYRPAADQNVIDDRATAGITLARQEASAAQGAADAAQEAIPSRIPGAPDAEREDKSYELHVPARGETSWREAGGAAVDQVARDAVAAEATARADADTALGARVDALAAYAAPVFEPTYWVKSGDARSIVVHIDPRAATLTGLAKVRLTVQGVSKTVAAVAGQDVYAFAIAAADAGTISRAVGNEGSDTAHADVTLLDASDAELQRWRGLLRVLDSAPGGGGITMTYPRGVRFTGYRFQSSAERGGSIGRVTLTGAYPTGTTRETFIGAAFVTAVVYSDPDNEEADFRGALSFLPVANGELAASGPVGTFERAEIFFDTSAIELRLATNSPFDSAERNGWTMRLAVAS